MIGAKTQPVDGSRRSAAHAFLSSQFTGFPGVPVHSRRLEDLDST